MMFFKHYIEFTLLYNNETYRVKTFEGEYDDLRELINHHIQPPNFGRCDGMGRCATCMVAQQSRNLSNKAEISLSCQLSINDRLANTEIRILPYSS
jgi:2Fe-2S ferredoxin